VCVEGGGGERVRIGDCEVTVWRVLGVQGVLWAKCGTGPGFGMRYKIETRFGR